MKVRCLKKFGFFLRRFGGFDFILHIWSVGAIPTYRVYRLSDVDDRGQTQPYEIAKAQCRQK